MKKDDLTQVKNIGPSRMKLLNDFGITTIKQLDETSLEKLAQIESIGLNYAKLIKDAVTEYYGKNYNIKAIGKAPQKFFQKQLLASKLLVLIFCSFAQTQCTK